ncbi:glucose dehydrogenase [FAD, quinone]-like [Anticarsia gemmatalis]|uniref:glucose dehydrogenase [FAD, quinone]-like n=1 Tax=Anticarsia gemmatalis TaxID=129554 RepID=UPI003F767163
MSTFYLFQFFLFSACVHIFTLFTYLVYYSDLFATSYLREIEPEYDYIIVGCGTAGSVIAHRLATETNYTFIVLEAGSRSHDLLEAPVLGPFMHGSVFDWQYQTVPQEHACFGMKDKKCKLAQGKIIGGSSKLNNMIHIRGNLSHYSQWFHGKYDEKYIKKQFELIENNVLHLSDIQYQSELSETVLKAAKELGYENIDLDFKLGFMKTIVSQKNGKRWSTSDKLDISKYVISNVMVEKVIFDGNTAKGVIIIMLNKKHTIFARKGVILSAGAINTPKILQLSGIGPKNLLESLGMPVVKNLPVGCNLQDHIGSGLDFVLFNNSISISAMDMINPIHVLQYLLNGKGPWTTPGCEVIGFLSTKNKPEPDILFMVLPVGISSDRGSLLKNNVNIDNEAWSKYFSKTFDKYTGTIMPIILHPKSKGVVFINSTNPNDPPLIDPKYLSHKKDRETLINGLKLVMKFVNTNAIQNIGGFINPIHYPGCEQFEIFTDSYFDCYIKHLTLTSYHPIGTCSMGLPTSKNSVVDTSFRVLGVNRLYVADASVLPTMPSGNINAAVAMMASVFFETSIKNNVPVSCDNNLLYEYLFQVCLSS